MGVGGVDGGATLPMTVPGRLIEDGSPGKRSRPPPPAVWVAAPADWSKTMWTVVAVRDPPSAVDLRGMVPAGKVWPTAVSKSGIQSPALKTVSTTTSR